MDQDSPDYWINEAQGSLSSFSNSRNLTGPGSQSQPPSTPKSPLRSVVRAHLPNQQVTTVKVKAGQTIREALCKAMRIRKLTTEMCDVYTLYSKSRVDWDQDVSSLEGQEIVVETRERFPISTSISHNFVWSLYLF